MWSIPFNNASESYWKKWVNGAIFSSHCTPLFTNKQRHKFWMRLHQLHWTNIRGEMKVFDLLVNGVNYFIWFQNFTSRRRWEALWGHEMTASLGGTLPPGSALINWGLVRFVGLSVLKWASVSSSPSPDALRGYLVVIPPRFSGFLSHISFHSQRSHLKRKRLLPSPLLEVTLWAMMWWRRTRDNILTCTLLV